MAGESAARSLQSGAALFPDSRGSPPPAAMNRLRRG